MVISPIYLLVYLFSVAISEEVHTFRLQNVYLPFALFGPHVWLQNVFLPFALFKTGTRTVSYCNVRRTSLRAKAKRRWGRDVSSPYRYLIFYLQHNTSISLKNEESVVEAGLDRVIRYLRRSVIIRHF